MYNQSKNVFKYTKYESNFYIYHDALTQLNENETIAYMQQKGIDKHWILPLHGLNKGTRWEHRPTGYSPEFNPLDRNLFRDLHACAESLISNTYKNSGEDPKYSLKNI